jgi:hypothetical protein
MKALRLISSASFGPEVLKVMGQAFDQAWSAIELSIGTDPSAIEAARLRLANIVVKLANEHTRDMGTLARAALRTFVRKSGISN